MKKATLIVSGLFAYTFSFAQTDGKVEVMTPIEFHITKPLSEIATEIVTEDVDPDADKVESLDRQFRACQKFQFTAEKDGPQYGNDPSTIQKVMGTKQAMATLVNFAGQNGGGCPPDPTGAVGPNNYVQAVNATPLRVYSKIGATLLTTTVGALFGSSVNDGDPIVLYDRYADRWFISQFGSTGNKVFIAISQTSNPTGAYYTYTYTSPQFPDYLKFSVWADGYYMTSNQATDKVFCFERAQMLVGNPAARSISANFTTGSVSGFFVPMPADADGGLPPAGTPMPFFSYYENSWGGGVDALKIWSMTVNWVPTTPTATISAAISVPTAAFDGTYDPSWNDIAQSTGTQKLDGIGGVLGFRAQWRKWTGYNSVVLCWPVKISATTRSIKWAELRQNQSTSVWSLYQEGIYNPDILNRWMGSIAMDDNGSIALCFAVSGPTPATPPSLRFTGRLASDPLGVMTFAEQTAIAGSGISAAGCGNRYGDYAQTTMDPDGITFWHTGTYIVSGYRTRIYSFQLPLTPLGINEAENQPSLTVSQSEGTLNLIATKLPSGDEMVVDLFDISGRQISGKKIKPVSNAFNTTIDVNGLAKGTYLVRIGNTNFQKVIKAVVN